MKATAFTLIFLIYVCNKSSEFLCMETIFCYLNCLNLGISFKLIVQIDFCSLHIPYDIFACNVSPFREVVATRKHRTDSVRMINDNLRNILMVHSYPIKAPCVMTKMECCLSLAWPYGSSMGWQCELPGSYACVDSRSPLLSSLHRDLLSEITGHKMASLLPIPTGRSVSDLLSFVPNFSLTPEMF